MNPTAFFGQLESKSRLPFYQVVASGLILVSLLPSLAHGTSEQVNTETQESTGFKNGTLDPFTPCTLKEPNTAEYYKLNETPCIKFYWEEAAYDGTRLKRGAEACSKLHTFKEGWYGFSFYLPSPGYPDDKVGAIAQIFQSGRCKSWGALLVVDKGSLRLNYRFDCGHPTVVTISETIKYNTWNPIIIHFVASHENAGSMQVWYGDACKKQADPTYNIARINFGFGEWDKDVLTAENQLTFKMGQYNFDDKNYIPNETRTDYYTNVCQLSGNPKNAWNIVNPLNP